MINVRLGSSVVIDKIVECDVIFISKAAQQIAYVAFSLVGLCQISNVSAKSKNAPGTIDGSEAGGRDQRPERTAKSQPSSRKLPSDQAPKRHGVEHICCY